MQKFEAGVSPYSNRYLELGYKPEEDELLIAFKVTPRAGTSMEEAASAVAAESSVGTWTEVELGNEEKYSKFKARVYRIEGDIAYISYPLIIFEKNSIPNILSSVVGNVFGFKAVSALRIEDMKIPLALVNSFPGPKFGLAGVRKILGVKDRPMTGSTEKPKLGNSPKEHAYIAYNTLRGGIDTVKDDENLNSQTWSNFYKRADETLKAVNKAEKETGESKGWWANVTAGNTEEMLRRCNYIAKKGGKFVMIDYLTAGFAATASLRKRTGELGLALHCHRAMHSVIDRQPNHGVEFKVLAKWARLTGVDHLHTGTGVGKLEGEFQDLKDRCNLLRMSNTPKGGGLYFDQPWGRLKTVVPVASGGLHPGLVWKVYDTYGNDAFFLFGGGTHGHPGGSYAGAKAVRAAVEAAAHGIGPDEAMKDSKELRQAIELWGTVKF
ncbi:MAG: ribulose-bisphosphate carboxylase large subunit [Candidatus Bathyarchaeia archaeon]